MYDVYVIKTLYIYVIILYEDTYYIFFLFIITYDYQISFVNNK